jgi:hypothetical protein
MREESGQTKSQVNRIKNNRRDAKGIRRMLKIHINQKQKYLSQSQYFTSTKCKTRGGQTLLPANQIEKLILTKGRTVFLSI